MASRVHGLVSEGGSGVIALRPVVLDISADGISFLSRQGDRCELVPFSCLRVQQASVPAHGIVLRGASNFPVLHVRNPEDVVALRSSVPADVAKLFKTPSKRGPSKRVVRSLSVAALVVSLLAVIGMVSIEARPSLMTSAVRHMPSAFEVRLGDAALDVVKSETVVVEDDLVVGPVQRVAEVLLTSSEDIPFDFRVAIVDSTDPDVMLLPGGRIVVTTGLLSETRNPEEFAGILAHQIQHAVLRHPLVAFEQWLAKSKSFDLWGVVFGYDRTAVSQYVHATDDGYFTRFQELEAQLAAEELLARAGLSSAQFRSFMGGCDERVSADSEHSFCADHRGLPEVEAAAQDRAPDLQTDEPLGRKNWEVMRRQIQPKFSSRSLQ